jgi:hypothetical protein
MQFAKGLWYSVTVKSDPRRLQYVGHAMTGWPPDPLQPAGIHVFQDDDGRLVAVNEAEIEEAVIEVVEEGS